MNLLRKLLATGVTALALIGPGFFPTAAQGGHEFNQPISWHYAVYYRNSDTYDNGPWVLYGAYNDPVSAYNVANWLQANWPYQTFIWTY